MPVVKVARLAGQFAKPRSQPTETIGGVTLPSYRGDIVNGIAFDAAARAPDPQRMLRAYNQSAATLNLLRAFTQGGFADLRACSNGTRHSSPLHRKANATRISAAHPGVTRVHDGMRPCVAQCAAAACDRTLHQPRCNATELRGTAGAAGQPDRRLVRVLGAPAMVGERTRQANGAHVAFLRGVANPLGLKCGPAMTPDEVLRLIDVLNPQNEPGRLTLITRVGTDRVGDVLPPLIRAVQREGRCVVWSCDPMHGNTIATASGRKTRPFERIMCELRRVLRRASGGGQPSGRYAYRDVRQGRHRMHRRGAADR